MRHFKKALFLALATLLFGSYLQAEMEVVRQPISFVEEIEYNGVGKLIVRQGDKSELTIRGEPGFIHDTRIRTAHGRVYVERKLNALRPPLQDIVCIVTVKRELHKIILRGEVNLDSQDLKLDDLEIDMRDLTTANVLLTGADFRGTIRDRATLTMHGAVNNQRILVEDFGSYLGNDFLSKTCEVKLVGSGVANVQADDTLSAFVVGSGTITYMKIPKKLNQRVSGSGSIQQQ
jgi:hypothetical protein